MTEKLHDILERIYNQGCYAGESSHIDDWLYEEGCDRADYITTMIREALGEQTAVKDSLNPAGNDAESRFVDKACEWIANMPIEYSEFIEKRHCQWIADDFRKAMRISGNNEEIPSNSCNSDKNLQGFDADAVVKESLTTELTWQDVQKIVEIADQMLQTAHDRAKWEDKSEEAYYTEILKRFKED